MIYIKTTYEEQKELPFVYAISSAPYGDQCLIMWAKDAPKMLSLDITGTCYAISQWRVQLLPEHQEAENWWHLCSIVGLTEPVARVFYKESACILCEKNGGCKAHPRGATP